MEEDLRLSFACLALFHLSGKPWAKGGVLTRDLARRLTAPIGLACPHGEEDGSALVLGIGLRLWAPALAVGIGFSFSLFHI